MNCAKSRVYYSMPGIPRHRLKQLKRGRITFKMDRATDGINRICIAGYGCISNAGDGIRRTLEGLYGTVPPPHRASARIETTLNDPVFELDAFPKTSPSRSLDLLEHALAEALENAGLTTQLLEKFKVGVCIGTTVAVQLNDIEFYRQQKKGVPDSFVPLDRFLEGPPSAFLRRKLRLTGPEATISNACASGADAIAAGALWIESGLCDLVIAGGVDELCRVPIAGFHALGVTSPEPCRPFDAERKGLNLGEGAGVVILASHRFYRHLHPEARECFFLAGCGSSADAYHITSPHPEGLGLERAIRQALSRARLPADRIAFLNAHGTGTLNNDACESAVFLRLFGEGVKYLSTKGKTGHTLGAAGTLELIFTLLMLQEGVLPPSAGFRNRAKDIPVQPVTERTAFSGEFALSTSLAFGGCNTALIVGKESAK